MKDGQLLSWLSSLKCLPDCASRNLSGYVGGGKRRSRPGLVKKGKLLLHKFGLGWPLARHSYKLTDKQTRLLWLRTRSNTFFPSFVRDYPPPLVRLLFPWKVIRCVWLFGWRKTGCKTPRAIDITQKWKGRNHRCPRLQFHGKNPNKNSLLYVLWHKNWQFNFNGWGLIEKYRSLKLHVFFS